MPLVIILSDGGPPWWVVILPLVILWVLVGWFVWKHRRG